ncbi:hypothetical protein [Dehalogenimonas etheniformans]|uniref:hypothetical protein n=1 Tax=Dehalogenimonas etheniformans TaxID=1536648 RepID=UPI0013922C07|nr:hypothetical protein [Dehalogenimonas etheniformans]QNT76935.1 hypothetical protein HX448_09745 [Dehalogenimonas etheniformans]
MQVENHKGCVCLYQFQICQEGFCSDCYIHQSAIKKTALVQLKTGTAPKELLKTVTASR